MKKSGRGIPRDRLSELPLSIILHILSLLPIRDVIKTTLLSKRWQNLWTNVPCLNFTGKDYRDFKDEKVRSFVNRALLFWKGSKILKFNFVIEFSFDYTTLAGDVDLWVRFAVDHNVEELNIELQYSMAQGDWIHNGVNCPYTAPQCLYSCSSLTKLSLEGCNLKNHGNPTWNHLKNLKLADYCYTEDLINRIMLGSPLLEEFELEIVDVEEDLNIQSRRLKRLKIHHRDCGIDPPVGTMLRICCPNLEILEISGFFFCDYRLESVSSLRDVTFTFKEPSNDGYEDVIDMWREKMLTNLRDLVSGLEQMERLALSGWCFEVLTTSEKLFRPLPNVMFIKLSVDDIEHQVLVDFLACFPNLRILVFEVMGTIWQDKDCTFID